MIANYHTHTPRCNHAVGTEEEYIETALNAGMKLLGFSDHTPYFFDGDYYSGFRMRPELLPDYARTVLWLRELYRDRIDIRLGVECEYYPKHFQDVLSLLRDNQVEYLILGQHFTGNEYDSVYGGRATDEETRLRQYCHQAMDAMNTGLFTYFAHPDLLHFRGDPGIYLKYMREVAREANSCGMALEINLLGLREGKWYPNLLFLEAAAEENSKMILGADAHEPSVLDDPETEATARAMAARFGLEILDTVPIRSIL